MAKLMSEMEETSVRLLTIQVSEDELAVLLASLGYLLGHSDDATLERVCGAYRDEVEGIRDDLIELLDTLDSESEDRRIIPALVAPR